MGNKMIRVLLIALSTLPVLSPATRYDQLYVSDHVGYYDLSIEEKLAFLSGQLQGSARQQETALEALNMECLFSAMRVDKHEFLKEFESGHPAEPWKKAPEGKKLRELFHGYLRERETPVVHDKVRALVAYSYSDDVATIYLRNIAWIGSNKSEKAGHDPKARREVLDGAIFDGVIIGLETKYSVSRTTILSQKSGQILTNPELAALFAGYCLGHPAEVASELTELECDLEEWCRLAVLFISTVDIPGYLDPAERNSEADWFALLQREFFKRLSSADEAQSSKEFYGLARYFYTASHRDLLNSKGDWTTEQGRKLRDQFGLSE